MFIVLLLDLVFGFVFETVREKLESARLSAEAAYGSVNITTSRKKILNNNNILIHCVWNRTDILIYNLLAGY